MRNIFTRISHNKKTGPIPVSYSESNTCPDNCELKSNGCYAENGNVGIHWRKLDNKKWGVDWNQFIKEISILPKGQLWRHNIAGDLPGNNNTIDHQKLNELVEVNKKSKARGFTFTHKPVGKYGQELINAQAIFASNKSGFTINLSADNLSQADKLSEIGAGPVVVVLSSDHPDHSYTPKGRHVIACPAENKDITCDRCQLCSKPNRKAIIGFRAHGVMKDKVNRRLAVIQ